MNRTAITLIFATALLFIASHAAFANWQVYYTGKAAGMFGSYGRGSFATRSECEAYRTSRPWFESGNSYCSGFDAPTYQSQKPSQQQGGGQTVKIPQTQSNPPASSQSDEAQAQKFRQEKAALIGSIRMPEPGEAPRDPVISPSRFATPAMCEKAKQDREELKDRLVKLGKRSQALDASMAKADKRIEIEQQEQVAAMVDVAGKLLDLGVPAAEQYFSPAGMKAYRSIQTAVSGFSSAIVTNGPDLLQSGMETSDKINDLAKEVVLDPKAPENVRKGMESTNRCLSVLFKAAALEMKERGPNKAQDLEALTKDYVRFAVDVLAIYNPAALPASVGMDVDEALKLRRNAIDMERRLNLLKASQFNAKEYLESETLNTIAQLQAVERTVGICNMSSNVQAAPGAAPSAGHK